MPHDNKHGNSASSALAKLRQKHSDRSHQKKGKFLSSLSPSGNSAKSHSYHGDFHTSNDSWTGASYRRSLRQLYTFFFLEMSLLLVWVAYRAFTSYPVWVDEGITKAIVFGFPVVWFSLRSKFINRSLGLDVSQMLPGLYFGTAVGGLYGFAAIIAEMARGREVAAASLYLSPEFWWLAFLALLTAWWESLFFFGLPVQYIRSVASWMSDWLIGIFVVILFLLFHAPLRLLVTGVSPQFVAQMSLLALFVIGQFIVYTRTKNMYALVLSHFFWGLVIEIYGR